MIDARRLVLTAALASVALIIPAMGQTASSIVKAKTRDGRVITVEFGRFAKYFDVSDAKFEEGDEVNELGRVVDFRRIAFVATARHDINTVPPGVFCKFLDSSGVEIPAPFARIRRKGFDLFGGYAMAKGTKFRCYIDLDQHTPAIIRAQLN